jgi:putative ABC transport system permease protein
MLERIKGSAMVMVNIFRAAGLLALAILLLTSLTRLTLAVEERRSSLATLRAIGFTRGQVVRLILAESILLLMPPAILGGCTILALFGEKGIRLSDFLLIQVAPWMAGAVALFGILLGVLVGAIPAQGAARIDVLDALRGD